MANSATGEESGLQGLRPMVSGKKTRDKANGDNSAYNIVVWMLVALLILVVIMLTAPPLLERWGGNAVKEPTEEMRKNRMDAYFEYYKWCLSVLVGSFGAWIGAGAAYFFGKENLKESSASTERALKIQQGGGRTVERIKDLALTAINTAFLFSLGDKVAKVREGLDAHRGYWFVPVLDGSNNGTIADVVHAQVFWKANDDDLKTTIKIFLEKVDVSDQMLKELRGDSFFLQVSPDDRAEEVLKRMKDKDLAVGIVVDGKNRPTHCFTQMELNTFLTTTT
jgi:hypothetical protein